MSEEIDLSGIEYVSVQATQEIDHPIGFDFDLMVTKSEKMMQKMENNDKKVEKKDVPKLKEDPAVEKTWLMLYLRNMVYAPEFRGALDHFKDTKFDKMSLEQLRDTRKQIDAMVSAECSIKDTKSGILTTIQMIETMATIFTPIQCKGLYKTIESDPDALADIKHVCLKWMPKVSIEPEYRLARKILTVIGQLHASNSLGIAPSNPNLDKVNEKYNDL